MAEENKWVDAVAKLLELTQDGKLIWSVQPPLDSLKRTPDDRIEAVFVAKYKERNLRLFRLTLKVIPNDDIFSAITIVSGMKSREPYWSSQVNLEFIDNNNIRLWAFPYVSVLNDLLSAVQYQVAGVKDFLDDIFKEAA